MEEVSIPELTRRVEGVERRFTDFARKDLYERDLAEIHKDISDIKESVKWATRGVLGVFIAIVADVVVRVATQGLP